jgi:hypothetical protein
MLAKAYQAQAGQALSLVLNSRKASLERQGSWATPLLSVHQIDLMQSRDRVAGLYVVGIKWPRQPGSQHGGRAAEGGDQ